MWSVMIPTYNCAEYTAQTIDSVLDQDLGEDLMQIEVIDDCSSDNIEEVVKRYGGERVKFFRQDTNVGHVSNFETAIRRAKGEYIHLLHGDDFVLPNFYESMTRMYEAYPEIGACYCRHFFVDENSNIKNISELIKKENSVLTDFHKTLIHGQKIQTPSITVKKEVYERLGTFNKKLSWTEDWEMWVRISSKYPIGYIKDPLASYRIHTSSSSGTKALTGENVNDLLRIKDIFRSYTSKSSERNELDKSFNKIIYNVASNNYRAAKAINHPDANKHLLIMAKNARGINIKTLRDIKNIIKMMWNN